MLNLEIIGNKITRQRKKKEMTQQELADALHVTHQAVSKWENGISMPSLDVLLEITKFFNVSIDFLLNDVEIKRDDYQSLILNYSRETVINMFIHSENPTADISKIFYLLSDRERKHIINLLVSNNLSLDVSVLWSYLNDNERRYLLGIILSNKYDYNLKLISHKLTNEESMICRLHGENYHYPLRFTYLHTYKGTKIRKTNSK